MEFGAIDISGVIQELNIKVKMTKLKCALQRANTRPDKAYVVTLGKYLREQRISMGVKSVAELVEMIDGMISIPPDLVSEKQLYNLEGAVKAQSFNIWELGAIATFAETLFQRNPRSKYLINPKYARPYTDRELAAIGMGWLEPETGELKADLDLDPKIQELFLGK